MSPWSGHSVGFRRAPQTGRRTTELTRLLVALDPIGRGINTNAASAIAAAAIARAQVTATPRTKNGTSRSSAVPALSTTDTRPTIAHGIAEPKAAATSAATRVLQLGLAPRSLRPKAKPSGPAIGTAQIEAAIPSATSVRIPVSDGPLNHPICSMIGTNRPPSRSVLATAQSAPVRPKPTRTGQIEKRTLRSVRSSAESEEKRSGTSRNRRPVFTRWSREIRDSPKLAEIRRTGLVLQSPSEP